MKIWLLFLLLLIAGLIVFGILYIRFKNSPAAQWAGRVRAKVREWNELIRNAEAGESAFARQIESLHEKRFREHVDSIPLDELANYPNIGPVTVESLKSHGYTRVGQMWQTRWLSVPGIGEVRGRALMSAAEQIREQARSAFDAGSNRAGQDYRNEVAALTQRHRAESAERQRKRSAAERALSQIEPMAEKARQVTFLNQFFHSQIGLVPQDMLIAPLPELVLPAIAITVEPEAREPVPPPVRTESSAAKPVPTPTTLPNSPRAKPIPTSSDNPFADRPKTGTPVVEGPSDNPQLRKLRASADLLMVVAKADSRIAISERKEIRDFLTGRFGHDAVLVRHIDPTLERSEKARPSEAEAIAAVKACLTEAECRQLLAAAHSVADAAGEKNPREEAAIVRIAAGLGIVETPMADPIIAVPAPASAPAAIPSDPRKLLEIDPGVELSVELIRRKYAMLSDKLCPDKAASLGTEFARLAEEKKKALRQAAETLIRPFGVPLDAPAAPPPPQDIRHNPELDELFKT